MCRRPASPSESDNASDDSTETYIKIVTSGGRRIPVHANILASASPVLESIINKPRKHRTAERTIPIAGVPCDAVVAFVGFLYSSRCSEEDVEKYGIHLLALSHVYLVPQLKSRCTKALIERLTIENVVDVLQLARLCDAPDVYLKCMKLVSNKFKSVEETEGWKFLQKHDPFFELEILQFIDETESRRKRSRRHRREQNLYMALSEAMDCLEHICTEGCISVGPYDVVPRKDMAPCSRFSTCQGLQLSIQHFANCKKRVNGGCVRCKRMWQLFKLHASICELPDSACRVPLCSKCEENYEETQVCSSPSLGCLCLSPSEAQVLEDQPISSFEVIFLFERGLQPRVSSSFMIQLQRLNKVAMFISNGRLFLQAVNHIILLIVSIPL